MAFIKGPDGSIYEVRPHPTVKGGYEVWRDGDDVGSFQVIDGSVVFQGRFTGKVDEATMTGIAERFITSR